MTETEIERLVVRLTGDATGFFSMIAKAATGVNGLTDIVRTLGIAIGGALGVGSLALMGRSAIELASDLEKTTISFETMLGSADKAKQMLKDIQVYAAATPFEQAPLRQSAQMLMNYGIAAESVMPILKQLGDVSAGDQNKLNGLAYAFAQMTARGHVAGDDLRQMINWGFNPLQEMARTSGRSMASLTEQLHAGGITLEMLNEAFRTASSEGGRFFGMMDKQSRSLFGLWSTAKDEMAVILTEIGTELVKNLDLKGILQGAITALQVVRTLVQEYAGAVIQATGAIVGFAAGWASIRLAILAVRYAGLLWSGVQTLMIQKEVVLQSLMGPKAWVQMAAGLAVAAGVMIKMNAEFDKVEAKINSITEASRNAEVAITKLGDASSDPVTKLNALLIKQRELDLAKRIQPAAVGRETVADLAAMREILGLKAKAAEFDELALQRQAKSALAEFRKGATPEVLAQIAQLEKDIDASLQNEANERNGINALIAKQEGAIRALKAELDPMFELDEAMAKAGNENTRIMIQNRMEEQRLLEEQLQAKRDQMDLERKVAQMAQDHIKTMKDQAKTLVESLKTPSQKVADEIKKAKQLFKEGFINKTTLDNAIVQANKSLEVHKDVQRQVVQGPFSAAVSGSSESQARIAEYIQGTKGVSIGQKQLNALGQVGNNTKAMNALLVKIEKTSAKWAAVKPPQVKLVAAGLMGTS
jgi:tape measure domain-containing protein